MKNIKGIALALISSGTFGLIPLFSIPLLAAGMDSPSVLFYRFLISAIMMAVVCLIQKKSFRIPLKHIFAIFILSLLYAFTALFLILSYNYIPSGIATTIHFMYPILVSIIMVVFFREQKSVILFLAAILSVVGVVLLCWTGGDAVQFKGIVIASLTILTYATYIIGINKSEAGKIDTEILTFYILAFGALVFLVTALLKNNSISPIGDTPSFVRLLLLALLCTVISDVTLIMAIKQVGSTITSILGSMEPLVAVFVGVIVFSEHFDLLSFLGIILIIVSVGFVVARGTKQNKIKKSACAIEKQHHNPVA